MSSLSKNALLLRCCYLFYQEGMNIQEVARHLGISRFRVSRYLKEARDKGIVQIQIHDPGIEYERLALELERTFSLQRVVVVPTPYEADMNALRLAIGQAGADLFSDIKPETSVGITWGRTIAHMVASLSSETLQAKRVVELAGGFGEIASGVSAHAIASRIAEKLKAECVYLPAPIIVDSSETARSLLAERSVLRTLELASQCDIAVVGVGPIDFDFLLHRSGFLSAEDVQRLQAAGAVGSVLGRFYDLDGTECATEYRTRAISLTLDVFRKIPERIALAGGSHKVRSILGLLRGGLVATLVTDSATATQVLKKAVSSSGRRPVVCGQKRRQRSA